MSLHEIPSVPAAGGEPVGRTALDSEGVSRARWSGQEGANPHDGEHEAGDSGWGVLLGGVSAVQDTAKGWGFGRGVNPLRPPLARDNSIERKGGLHIGAGEPAKRRLDSAFKRLLSSGLGGAALILCLSGCWQSTPVNVVAPIGQAATSLGQAQDAQITTLKAEVAQRDTVAASVAGNVYGAKKAKEAIAPDQPAKDAVGQELELASSKLPEPSAADQLAAEKRVTAILTGKLDEAKKLYASASTEAAQFKQQADALNAQIAQKDSQIVDLQAKAKAEQEANAKSYKAALDAKDRQIAQAKDEAQKEIERQQRKWQTAIFFGVGALLVAGGIVVMLTASSVPMFGPKIGFGLLGAGGGLITLGILVNQIQNFFEAHTWIVGAMLAIIALVLAGAAALAYSNHQHAKTPA